MKDEKVSLCCLPTPITRLDSSLLGVPGNNEIFIKRDDMTGFVLGGNKTRKLEYFISQALRDKHDFILTYGSIQSNHCSATAAVAAKHGLLCRLILAEPEDVSSYEGNFFLYDLYGASFVFSKVDQVSERITHEMESLRLQGYNPYFISGGGHGNLGTHAYVKAYEEIQKQQVELGIKFDYIFHASGTGTTQAGLIVGKLSFDNQEKVIGISIARNTQRGVEVIKESVKDYCKEYMLDIDLEQIEEQIAFIDDYVGGAYGNIYPQIIDTIRKVAQNTGILLDPTYTGKAFYGMIDYLGKKDIKNRNILFIHTGGIPILLSNSRQFKG